LSHSPASTGMAAICAFLPSTAASYRDSIPQRQTIPPGSSGSLAPEEAPKSKSAGRHRSRKGRKTVRPQGSREGQRRSDAIVREKGARQLGPQGNLAPRVNGGGGVAGALGRSHVWAFTKRRGLSSQRFLRLGRNTWVAVTSTAMTRRRRSPNVSRAESMRRRMAPPRCPESPAPLRPPHTRGRRARGQQLARLRPVKH
jgi:hypothetical protein